MCSVREGELRQLRRQNTEYEEQNAILSKHVDNMKQAIEKLEVEATQQRSNNAALQQHLDLLRTTLVANFSRIPLPGCYSECTPCVGLGHPSSPLSIYFLIFSPLLLFSFFHWLYLFSSFVHPFPFYQNSPTPFPGRRS